MTTVEIILAIVAALLGSTGLSTVVVACLNRHWSKKDKEHKGDPRIDALVEAQIVSMLDRICWLGEKYIEAGEIRLSDLLKLESMYKVFKKLGGNGDADPIMDKVRVLPVAHE